MGKLKVVIANALFHPFSGGVEKHTLELAAAMVKQGVEVHVVTGRLAGTKEEETLRGIRVHRIPCTELRIPRYYPPPMIVAPGFYRALQELDAKHDFDVIHLQDRWFPDFNLAIAYAKRAGKPSVVTLHNARPVGIAPHYTLVGGLYDSLVGKRVLRKANYIISVSEWAAGDISHYGISRSKITVIHNGINTNAFKPGGGKSFKRKHGITGRMLLFVGRVIRQKGLEHLVAAMPEVLRATPDTTLVIIGRGNRLEHVKKRVRKLSLEESVVFPGFVSERELKEALRECDAFVLPSLWEVLPVSILEAMASGKPIVCTDAGGNRELVQNGFNGFVVPKRDPKALAHAVARVLRDEKLRTKMGRNSRRKAVAEFGWNRIASLTIALYRNAAAGNRAPTPNGAAALARLSQELSHRKLKFENYLESFETQWKKLFKARLKLRDD